jgi:hypothetical protein
MRALRLAIIIMVLASLVTVGNAQEANYAGAAKIVLEIVNEENVPVSSSLSFPGYNVHVIYSDDPAIIAGQNYDMYIIQEEVNYYGTLTGVTPTELVPGTVIGINNYQFGDNIISVTVQGDPDQTDAWEQQITILGTANTDSSSPTGDTSTDTSTLLTPSMFSSMPSIGTGSSLLNFPSENVLTDNTGIQTPSTLFGSSTTSGQDQPFNLFSNTLNAFPSFYSGTLFSNGGLI